MFYVSSIKNNLIGIMDTYDNIEEFYSVVDIKEFPSYIKINGVSSKGIKKINIGEAILTRDIVKKIDCEKELLFEVVDLRDILKYKLAGARDISDDFIAIETDTSIKLISDKTIMLEDGVAKGADWGLFKETSFTKIDFHSTNTSNISNMKNMFSSCKATSLDLSSFNTSNVIEMASMFEDCHATSLDLRSFDTSNVESMHGIFWDCYATSLDLSNFDTSNIKNMGSMFTMCHATSLDLSSFDTSNVVNMRYMFWRCQAISIDLSSFDTSNVANMRYMFDEYKGTIKSIDDRLLLEYGSRRLN